jgi:dihydrofolate reductase
MRLTINTFLTLDGVMQAPGGPTEDTTGGFDRGGWLPPFVDEVFGEVVDGWFQRCDAVLLGRTTFELMRSYWPQVPAEDDAVSTALNVGPKFVVSRTLTDPNWGDTTVLSGDPIEEVRALKERAGGELQVHGSAQLARTLHRAGLVDEYRLLTFPVTVGAGKRLFGEDAPPRSYRLVESKVSPSGVVYTALAPEEFRTGDVLEEEGA